MSDGGVSSLTSASQSNALVKLVLKLQKEVDILKSGSQGAGRDDLTGASRDDLTPPKSNKLLKTHSKTRSEDYEEHDYADHVADYDDEPTFCNPKYWRTPRKRVQEPYVFVGQCWQSSERHYYA